MFRRKPYLSLVLVFVFVSLLAVICWGMVPLSTVDARVLLIGNLILFLVSSWSYQVNVKALYHQNLQVFLRKVYGSLFLKLILLSVVALTYIAIQKKDINKPALFTCFGLYFIYSFMEVRLVMQQRKQPNA